MRNSALFFLCLLSVSMAAAQDYRAFSGAETRLYEYAAAPENIITSVVVDEVSFDGDSIYSFAPRWLRSMDSWGFCYSPYGPSLVGSKLRVLQSGTHLFHNLANEPIEIRPQAGVGETWTAYTGPDTVGNVLATVSQVNQHLVLGQVQPVKTIALQRVDADGQTIDSPINELYFEFAQTSGLIAAPSLRSFPEMIGYSDPEMLFLKGIDGGPGIQNLTHFDLMDFQPGDRIDIETAYIYAEYEVTYRAERYLERTDYPDSIVYAVEVKTYTYFGPGPPDNSQFTLVDSSVAHRVIIPDPHLDAPPGTTDPGSYEGPEGEFWMEHGIWGLEKKTSRHPMVYEPLDSITCPIWDTEMCNSGTQERYIQGLGGPYYSCINPWDQSLTWRKIRFFRKDNNTWGTPLPTSYPDGFADLIKVYPNPSSGFVRVELPPELAITGLRLRDLHGRTITSKAKIEGAPGLDIHSVEAGIYLLEINLPSGAVLTRKIVVAR